MKQILYVITLLFFVLFNTSIAKAQYCVNGTSTICNTSLIDVFGNTTSIEFAIQQNIFICINSINATNTAAFADSVKIDTNSITDLGGGCIQFTFIVAMPNTICASSANTTLSDTVNFKLLFDFYLQLNPVFSTSTTTTVGNGIISCFSGCPNTGIPPIAICKPYTVVLDANGNGTLTANCIDGGSYDECMIDSLFASQTVFDTTNTDSVLVTLYVQDFEGNIDSCVSTVTVIDNTPIIPFGISSSTIRVYPSDNNQIFIASISNPDLYSIHYYKSSTYDSLTSPILLYIHGTNGSGASSADLYAIAERQKALIVAPTMHGTFAYVRTPIMNTFTGCSQNMWLTSIMKQIYRHVKTKEQRDSIPVYLTGFSQGGQFTSRYMFIRQFSPDSIPIKMAVSVSPFAYIFMTDSLFGPLNFESHLCGLGGNINTTFNCSSSSSIPVSDVICEEHIKQYYNENYGVLIGTLDTAAMGSGSLCFPQGNSRYERAENFYAFSDTNAITRGTTLQWVIDSVFGVGHYQYDMYNNKLNATDSFTIAENLLFNPPYHIVPQFTPITSFVADTQIVYLPNATVQFTNQSTPGNYLWNFGDGNTSSLTNPNHTYTSTGTFSVTLTVNSTSCSDSLTLQNYISVLNSVGIKENSLTFSNFILYPNPSNKSASIKYNISNMNLFAEIRITDLLGRNISSHSIFKNGGGQYIFNPTNSSNTVYLALLIVDGSIIETHKLFFIK